VTLVLIFGEIIPQSLCTGSGQLCIAYYACPMVLCLMYATSIFTWPLAKLLDYLLGEHKFQRYDNNQLRKLVLLHSRSALQKVEDHIDDNIKGISEDQARMIEGALSYQNVKCREVLTSLDKVVLKLRLDTPVTEELLDQICQLAFSRIPIVDHEDQIIGILLTKSLIGLRIRDGEEA
jgi:metal transporter CNNM